MHKHLRSRGLVRTGARGSQPLRSERPPGPALATARLLPSLLQHRLLLQPQPQPVPPSPCTNTSLQGCCARSRAGVGHRESIPEAEQSCLGRTYAAPLCSEKLHKAHGPCPDLSSLQNCTSRPACDEQSIELEGSGSELPQRDVWLHRTAREGANTGFSWPWEWQEKENNGKKSCVFSH